MTDSYLPSDGSAGARTLRRYSGSDSDEGVAATRAALSRLQQEGYRYAVLDARAQ